MPILAVFYGMIIRMYHADHNPPHFHVQYGEQDVLIEIRTGKVLAGKLAPRLKRDVEKWRKLHRDKLLLAWEDTQAFKTPKRIKPLD